jgi:hypothetical protein
VNGNGRSASHPWRLVAPWWRWPEQGVPAARTARATRPALQKYDGTDFVDRFLADPRRSLTYVAEDTWSYTVALPPSPVVPGTARRRRLTDAATVPTSTRKLFLPIHHRFYLVVCSLHCDVPGFPAAGRDDVCRAGFVVRRRSFVPPAGNGSPAAPEEVLRRIAEARTTLADVDLGAPAGSPGDAATADAGPSWSSRFATRLAAATQLRAAQSDLAAWAAGANLVGALEGWVPDPVQTDLGSWAPVEEEPDRLAELVHPLYPLVPDPDDPDHAGSGATVWFGAVPTGGAELDDAGDARFDDRSVYEVRCVVRRHDPRCPRRTGQADDCCGPLTWSAPSDRYLLAAPFDLDGTSHRPVTIAMPDVNTLVASVGTPKGGLRFAQPPGSLMIRNDGTDVGDGSRSAGFEICTFAIPLFTIVAFFVFQLFLGILMFVFGLWVLLALKLCIPPSIEVGGGLSAELAALPPSIDLDLDVSVSVRAQLDADLHAVFEDAFGTDVADTLVAGYSTQALADLYVAAAVDAPLSVTADLVWEEPVARVEVELR